MSNGRANLVAALVLAILGLVAVVRGRLFSWLDRRVFRPRMAGAAVLCLAVNLAIGGLGLSGGMHGRSWPLFSLPFLLAGCGLGLLSKIPDRPKDA